MTEIVSSEHWAQKGAARLYLFRKRPARAAGRVLFLVHGSSLSAIPSYDLHIAGHDDYSVMDHFARLGFGPEGQRTPALIYTRTPKPGPVRTT